MMASRAARPTPDYMSEGVEIMIFPPSSSQLSPLLHNSKPHTVTESDYFIRKQAYTTVESVRFF